MQTKDIAGAAPVAMIILDGWGVASEQEGNALAQAQTPTFDHLMATYPTTVLKTTGEELGYYSEEKPDIRSNYFCLGTGRPDNKALFRINKAIDNHTFSRNQTLVNALEQVKHKRSRLHIMGMVSEANIHSSLSHLQNLIRMATDNGIEDPCLHLILDGVDSSPDSGLEFVKKIEDHLRRHGKGRIVTVNGRFYALDRDNHWNRTAVFYNALIKGEGREALSASEAIRESYNKQIFDKEFYPTIIKDREQKAVTIEDKDALIIANIRGDRWKQITKALLLPGWEKIPGKKYLKNLHCVSLTEIERGMPIKTAFPSPEINNTLSEILGKNGLKQLKISGTEKFGLLTYDFNGRKEVSMANETKELVPKDTLGFEAIDAEVVSRLLGHIKNNEYQFILANFAHLDRAAALYEFSDIIKITEAVDSYLKKIVEAIIDQGGTLIVTASLGNIEELYDIRSEVHSSEDTPNHVPFILAGNAYEGRAIEKEVSGQNLNLLSPCFSLIDVTPTILKTLNISQPREMRGKSIL